MRRTFALAPSMIALIVVALLARRAGIAAPLAGEFYAAPRAHATVDRADGQPFVAGTGKRCAFACCRTQTHIRPVWRSS